MKESKEYKKWINWLRSKFGKKNGVISNGWLDCYEMEVKEGKNKNLKKNYKKFDIKKELSYEK